MAVKNTLLTPSATRIDVITPQSLRAVVVTYLCNTSDNPVSVNMYMVETGDTPSTNNIIYDNIEIAPHDTYILDTEKLIFEDSEGLFADASTFNDVVASVNYTEV